MTLNLVDLDDRTRRLMREEVERDIRQEHLYVSSRLSLRGRGIYVEALLAAIDTGDDAALAQALRTPGLLNATELRNIRGGSTEAKVPINAPEMLAEGEFNRFYMRALCRRAVDEECMLQVYRAKQVSSPRPESEARLGSLIAPEKLLEDLRTNIGIDTVLGLPPGPNSGLSVLLVH